MQAEKTYGMYGKGRTICKRHNCEHYLKKSHGHPRANPAGYVYEHILIAEEKFGRYITREESVHHINFDSLDNRPENLDVLSKSTHQKIKKNIFNLIKPLMERGIIIYKNGKYHLGDYDGEI